jgi:hypothetical protein
MDQLLASGEIFPLMLFSDESNFHISGTVNGQTGKFIPPNGHDRQHFRYSVMLMCGVVFLETT